jgi:hypothetical protein
MNRVDTLTRPSTSPVVRGHDEDAGRLDSISTKVKPCHLARKAIVYVRQSTVQQVLNNRESADRQYALSLGGRP